MLPNTITMSDKELTRYRVITQLIDKKITAPIAAERLQLTVRHTERLKKKVGEKGAAGLQHGNKGKVSNNKIEQKTKDKAIELVKEKYRDFGPTLAMEKLQEKHNINFSKETLRTFMAEEKLWVPKKRKGATAYHMKRERKEHYGEMQQFDGSYHDWFEGRSSEKEQCLLVAIDDATGQLTKATFAEHGGEGIEDVFPFWMDYLKACGAPKALYIDRFSTYKINNPSVADLNLKTNFERAMKELDINTITAHSPQAKGRVERVNKTLQDRLVKEMRLLGISDIETANTFLSETFIPKFNERFGVPAAQEGDVHRPLTEREQEKLPHTFSVKVTRKVNNDFTVMHNTKLYQLTKEQTVTVCKKDTVVVEKYVDGSIHILHVKRDRYLTYREIAERPKKKMRAVLPATRKTFKPGPNHPWRKPMRLAKSGASVFTTH